MLHLLLHSIRLCIPNSQQVTRLSTYVSFCSVHVPVPIFEFFSLYLLLDGAVAVLILLIKLLLKDGVKPESCTAADAS